MKKILALTLAVLMILSLASCGEKKAETPTEPAAQKSEYKLSDQVDEKTVVDGVMTLIDGKDPILKKSAASWLDTCVLYEVNVRQFTEEGTFKAFEGHLERLKGMGINTLWFMPIHPISETGRKGTLGSYYAVSDYKAVNPEFGTIDDFKHLVDKAHEMGFKVLLDWVANHTGWDNSWLKEHEDWYVRDESGKVVSPFDWTDVAKLNYDNYDMRAEMIRCMQYWVEDVGIDGYRCDHAIGVPNNFWNAAVYKLKSINSEIMMLAENSENIGLTEYAFDSCYNDGFYSHADTILGGVAVSSIKDAMAGSTQYAAGSFPMNYLDNHDKNSYEGSIVYRLENAYPALLALSYMAPGIPLIYTSDETAYDHELEFFEKDTVKWDDEPVYAPLITALSKLKTENKALASTSADITFHEPDNSKLFACSRSADGGAVYFIGSLSKEAMTGVTVDCGFEEATVVMHHDGAKLDTTEAKMTKADFEKKDYKPFEFYILVAEK